MFNDRADYNTPQYRTWRYGVFKRADYSCEWCGRKGCELNSHHIKKWADYPKLRYVQSNGICLCKDCHALVTGREEQYEKEFQNIIDLKRIQQKNIYKLNRKNNPKVKPVGEAENKSKRKRPKWRPRNLNLRF